MLKKKDHNCNVLKDRGEFQCEERIRARNPKLIKKRDQNSYVSERK